MAVAGLVGGGGFGPPPYIQGTGASFAVPLGQSPLSPGAGVGLGAEGGGVSSTALGSPFTLGAGGAAGLAASGAGSVSAAAGLSPTQAVGGCGSVSLSPECGCAKLAAPTTSGLQLANGLAGLNNLGAGGGGCS